MLEHAFRYARRGWRVIPAPAGSKYPTVPGWQREATCDLNQVIRWWTADPAANVCIATGSASGVWALDIDDKEPCGCHAGGGKGSCTLAALERDHGPLPPTYTVATGSGGVHYYFTWDGVDFDLRNSAGKLGPGLDTRGNGGQVVAPPSRAADPSHFQSYFVLDAREPAGSGWLTGLLRPRERTYTPRPTGENDAGGMLGWLASVQPGGQDDALCWVMRALRDEGKRAQEAGDLVWPVVAAWPCSAGPWTHRDIERHLRSAYGGAS